MLNQQDENYDQYKAKIKSMADNGETSHLSRELIWRPNVVLSMIFRRNESYMNVPLLYHIGRSNDSSLMSLYLGAIFHFQQKLLVQNTEFLETYLNAPNVVHDTYFVEF